MKKKTIVIIAVLVIAVILALSFIQYTKSMNYIINHTPSIKGFVTAMDEEYFHVLVEPTEKDPAAEYLVSRDVQNGDCDGSSIVVGDSVYVHYDGVITEDIPPQIHKVYAVVLDEPAAKDTYTAEGYYPLWMMDNSVIVYDGEGKPTVIEGGYLTPEEIEKKEDPITFTAKYMLIQPNTRVEYSDYGVFKKILFEMPVGSGNYEEEPELPPRPLGDCDKPGTVFNDTLKAPENLVKVEVQLGDDYLFAVEDPEKIVPLAEMFANATLIPYTPKTYNFTATLHFIYDDGSITSIPSDLGAYLCYMDDNYYNFAFRANGETLTALTRETVPRLLDMENWDESVGWYRKYRDFIAGL